MARSWAGRRLVAPPPVPDEVRAAYDRLVTRFLHLPRVIDDWGNPKPFVLRLSPDADEALRRFEGDTEVRLGEPGDLSHIADWGGKLVGATARIAGLVHLAEHVEKDRPWERAVSAKTVGDAVGIAELFLIPHALTAFQAMGADPALDAARSLLSWMTRTAVAHFSLRDAHQELRKHHLSTAQVATAAGLLVEHSYLRPALIEPAPESGRPPTPRFLVNPLWTLQKTQKAQNPGDDEESPGFEESESFETEAQGDDDPTVEAPEEPREVWEESL